jgi:hypothetical protein
VVTGCDRTCPVCDPVRGQHGQGERTLALGHDRTRLCHSCSADTRKGREDQTLRYRQDSGVGRVRSRFGRSLFGGNNSSDAGCVRLPRPDTSGRVRAAQGALWTPTGLVVWVRPVVDRCVRSSADCTRVEAIGRQRSYSNSNYTWRRRRDRTHPVTAVASPVSAQRRGQVANVGAL